MSILADDYADIFAAFKSFNKFRKGLLQFNHFFFLVKDTTVPSDNSWLHIFEKS